MLEIGTKAPDFTPVSYTHLHSTGKKDWQFTDSMVSSVCVFKLEVLEISGKENL